MSDVSFEIVDATDITRLELVTRMCMDTVLETIPEFGGDEAIARRHLPNFDVAQMLAMIARSAARPDHRILVAVDGEVVVGYSIFSIKDDVDGVRHGSFFSRGVLPSHRRRGIGARLLCEAETWLGTNGAIYLQAETHVENAGLRALFARHGFQVVATARGSWPYHVLRKQLQANA